jgi:hypothetical protein
MWGVGKRNYRKTFIARKRFVPRYRNPKVFTRKLQSSKSKVKINYHLSGKAVGNIFLVFFVLAAMYIVFYSKYFQVSDVIVEGNKIISTDKIKDEVPLGSNIIRLSAANIKKNITANYPEIKEIAVFKGLPNALKIQVVERQPVLVWMTAGKKYLVDADGVAYMEANDNQTTGIMQVSDSLNRPINKYDTVIPISFIHNVGYFYNHFTESSNMHITGMSIGETSYDLTATTDANISVIIDTTQAPDTTLSNLQKILVNYRDKITQYIDLRVGGWGYYK